MARKPTHVRALIRAQWRAMLDLQADVRAQADKSRQDGKSLPVTSIAFGGNRVQFGEMNGELKHVNAPPKNPRAAIERHRGLRPNLGEGKLRSLGTRPVEHGAAQPKVPTRPRMHGTFERFDVPFFTGGVLIPKKDQ